VEAEEAGAELHASRVEIADPFAKSDSPICGFVEAAVGGREIGIHFLHRIAGVGRDEVERTAVSIEAGGSNVRVMHPLLCLEGRVEMLLRRIGEAGHQDQLHLRRGILVVRALLAEQLAREAIASRIATAGAITTRNQRKLVSISYTYIPQQFGRYRHRTLVS
jgi:hypothetical protein